jgi:hypothetical protein
MQMVLGQSSSYYHRRDRSHTYAATSSARTSNFQPWKCITLDPGAAGTNLSWIITVRDWCTLVPVTIAVDPSQLLR